MHAKRGGYYFIIKGHVIMISLEYGMLDTDVYWFQPASQAKWDLSILNLLWSQPSVSKTGKIFSGRKALERT